MSDADEIDINLETWKIRKLIQGLEAAMGNGSGMISLIIPPSAPCDQISRVTKILEDEYQSADINLQATITSAQQRLSLYNNVPPNGLVVYSGTIVTGNGKEKKLTIDFEPFRPINTSLYLCDNVFHAEALNELLEPDNNLEKKAEQEDSLPRTQEVEI